MCRKIVNIKYYKQIAFNNNNFNFNILKYIIYLLIDNISFN